MTVPTLISDAVTPLSGAPFGVPLAADRFDVTEPARANFEPVSPVAAAGFGGRRLGRARLDALAAAVCSRRQAPPAQRRSRRLAETSETES